MSDTLSTEEWRKKDSLKEYEEIREFYCSLRKSLRILRGDTNLLKDHIKLYIAVDFHQIFDFSYPILFDYGDRVDIGIEDIRKKLSETFVFNHGEYKISTEDYGETVLLRPYVDELVSYIDYLKASTQEVKREMDLVLSGSREIFRQEKLDDLRKLIDQVVAEPTDEISQPRNMDGKWDELVLKIQKSFPEIYLVLSTGLVNAITILSDLFGEKKSKVSLLGDIFPGDVQFAEESIEGVGTCGPNEDEIGFGDLFESFEHERRDRSKQNSNDAKAICLIRRLNRKFETEKRTAKFLLYSDGRSTKKVLDKYALSDDILRGSYYFVDYLTMAGTNAEETTRNIDSKMSDIDEYFMWGTIIERIRSCSEECAACPDKDACCKIREGFTKHLEFYRAYNALRMIEHKETVLRPIRDVFDSLVSTRSKESGELKQNLRDFLDFILTDNRGLAERFDEKVAENISRLKMLEKGIKPQIIREILTQSIGNNEIDQLAVDLRRFGGVPWSVHFINRMYIEKTNQFYATIMKRFEDMSARQNSEGERFSELEAKFKEILNLIAGDEDGEEKWDKMLLKILLLFGFHEYTYALFMVESLSEKLDLASPESFGGLVAAKREAMLLELLILSKLIDASEFGRGCLVKAKSILEEYGKETSYTNDPRFWNLKGVIQSLGIGRKGEDRALEGEALRQCLAHYEEALEKYETNRPFQNSNDRNGYFKIALLNNILYTKLTILESKKNVNEKVRVEEVDEMASRLTEIENAMSNGKLESVLFEVTETVGKANLLLCENREDGKYRSNAMKARNTLYHVISMKGLTLPSESKKEIEAFIEKVDTKLSNFLVEDGI